MKGKLEGLNEKIQAWDKLLSGFEAEVGIVYDFDKRESVAGPRVVQRWGGPARSKSKKKAQITIGEVAHKMQSKYHYIQRAAKSPDNSLINDVKHSLILACYSSMGSKKPNEGFISSMRRRYLNACQALVRNPILRGEFPANSPTTIKMKGFNRPMINTGTFFTAIKAMFIKRGQ